MQKKEGKREANEMETKDKEGKNGIKNRGIKER